MPIATVAAILTRTENEITRILLTRRAIPPFKGQWCLPGGHIDAGEPARDAVIREVREEVGLEFSPHFFGYFDEIIPPRIHAVVLAFDGELAGELDFDPGEVAETAWFTLAEAAALPLAFQHNTILDTYIQKTVR